MTTPSVSKSLVCIATAVSLLSMPTSAAAQEAATQPAEAQPQPTPYPPEQGQPTPYPPGQPTPYPPGEAQPTPYPPEQGQPYPPGQPQPAADPYGPRPAPAPAPPPHPRGGTGKGMLIAGWSVFGAIYGLTALSGVVLYDTGGIGENVVDARRAGSMLLIPVAGPLAAMPQYTTLTARFVLFLSFAGQATGLALGIAGAVKYSRYRKSLHQQAINADGIRLTKNLRLNAGPTMFLDGGTAHLKYRF